MCSVTQSCLTFCNPMGWSLPGPSVHEDSAAKNTGVGCQARLQGIFPAQGSSPGLVHYRWILYHLSHQGSPRILELATYPFFRGSSQPRNWAGVSSIAGGFFTSWAIRETCWCIIMRSSRDQLSAFLDLVGFNEFRYCPQWLSFFLRLCPATFLSQKDSLPIWLWSMADFKLPWQSWANQAYHL